MKKKKKQVTDKHPLSAVNIHPDLSSLYLLSKGYGLANYVSRPLLSISNVDANALCLFCPVW